MAYGERLMIEACINFLAQVKNDANKILMERVFRIFAIDTVKKELGFYLINGAVSQVAAKSLVETQKVLIRETSKNINQLLEVLNVPEDCLYAPCAADYVDYYSRPNYGEAYVPAKL